MRSWDDYVPIKTLRPSKHSWMSSFDYTEKCWWRMRNCRTFWMSCLRCRRRKVGGLLIRFQRLWGPYLLYEIRYSCLFLLDLCINDCLPLSETLKLRSRYKQSPKNAGNSGETVSCICANLRWILGLRRNKVTLEERPDAHQDPRNLLPGKFRTPSNSSRSPTPTSSMAKLNPGEFHAARMPQ